MLIFFVRIYFRSTCTHAYTCSCTHIYIFINVDQDKRTANARAGSLPPRMFYHFNKLIDHVRERCARQSAISMWWNGGIAKLEWNWCCFFFERPNVKARLTRVAQKLMFMLTARAYTICANNNFLLYVQWCVKHSSAIYIFITKCIHIHRII